MSPFGGSRKPDLLRSTHAEPWLSRFVGIRPSDEIPSGFDPIDEVKLGLMTFGHEDSHFGSRRAVLQRFHPIMLAGGIDRPAERILV